MSKEKYYVYKIIDESDRVLYVGQSQNISGRVKSHLSNRHWIEEGHKFYVAEMQSKTDSDIYEIYFINKLKPFYNIANSNNISFSVELPNINFQLFKTVVEDDLVSRNSRMSKNINLDGNSIALGRRYSSKVEDQFNCGFKFLIVDEKPITILEFVLENGVDIVFYIFGGLHKFFYVKDNKNHIHNMRVYLFLTEKLMGYGADIDDDNTIVNLDTLDLSGYDIMNKEEYEVMKQNKVKEGEWVL